MSAGGLARFRGANYVHFVIPNDNNGNAGRAGSMIVFEAALFVLCCVGVGSSYSSIECRLAADGLYPTCWSCNRHHRRLNDQVQRTVFMLVHRLLRGTRGPSELSTLNWAGSEDVPTIKATPFRSASTAPHKQYQQRCREHEECGFI